jgi:hypothetical protein
MLFTYLYHCGILFHHTHIKSKYKKKIVFFRFRLFIYVPFYNVSLFLHNHFYVFMLIVFLDNLHFISSFRYRSMYAMTS